MFCRVWSFIYLIIFQTWSFVLFLTLSRQFCILSRYITTAFARGSPSAPHWGLCNTFCPGSWFACLSFNNFEYIFENLSENSVEKYITPLCHPHLCNTFWPRSWFACLSQSFQHILNIYLWKFILHKSAVCSGVKKLFSGCLFVHLLSVYPSISFYFLPRVHLAQAQPVCLQDDYDHAEHNHQHQHRQCLQSTPPTASLSSPRAAWVVI